MYRRSKNWAHSVGSVVRSSNIVAAPADPAEMVRIDAVINDAGFSSLNLDKQSFIKSIKLQAASKPLSAAQIKYLVAIEKMLVPVDPSWWNAEDAENIRKRDFAIKYYTANGYYTSVVARMDQDSSYMPEKSVWEKMWDNNYINARYKRHNAGAKFAVGQLVMYVPYAGFPTDGQHSMIHSIKFDYLNGVWCYSFLRFNEGIVRENIRETYFKAIKAEKPPAKPKKKKSKE